jgi:hypothetical protein
MTTEIRRQSGVALNAIATAALGLWLAGTVTRAHAQQGAGAPAGATEVVIDADDIGGIVSGSGGPEAGVWVIAETTDLPTKLAKIVVTDDKGRYLIPALPQAGYSIWVRGYGLVDSAKVQAAPGKALNLTATPAPNDAAAAQYYPAIYWYSMLEIPPASEFGGHTKIPKERTQVDWLKQVKNIGCIGCHQLGQAATRTIEPVLGPRRTSSARAFNVGNSRTWATGTLRGWLTASSRARLPTSSSLY